jgi:formate dehydrogenase major subunit
MDGTLTNLEGRVQRVRQAIPPVGVSRPGWMIHRDVADLMGAGHWNYSSAADVMAEIVSLVPAYRGVKYETLDVNGVVRRFEPAVKAQFVPFGLERMPQLVSDEFPFTLITERNLCYYHGACLTEQVKGMNLVKNEETLQLNSSDATRLGISDGTVVKVASPYGNAECVVQTSSAVPEGAAFTSINRVTGSPLFPTFAPTTKACAVRIGERSRRGEV